MHNDTKDKLQALTKAYATHLPKKLQEISLSWQQIQRGELANLEVFIREMHTLAGTAGTYGYQKISQLAKQIETRLREITGDNLAEKQNELDPLMEQIMQLSLKPEIAISDVNVERSSKESKRHILVLEPESSRAQSESIFAQLKVFGIDFIVVSNMTEFRQNILNKTADIALIDISFADYLTENDIKTMREEFMSITFSGVEDNLIQRLKSVRHAGQAYILKPYDQNFLLRTIDNIVSAKAIQNDRVLIMDDSASLTDYYKTILEQSGLIVETVNDPLNFLNVLQEFQPDLILMDINMPFCSGSELAQIVHQQENLSGIPIIYLSSITERAKQLELLSFAGDDFLTKPVEPKFLLAAVRNRLMRSRLLRERMMRDSLTNLYNHTMIHHQLERELVIAERYQRPLAVVLFDIDHFKKVNDTYGHPAGDKILKDLSVFLQKHLRKSDLIGRYGGEEFLAVLPNTGPDNAMQLVDALRKSFAEVRHEVGDQSIKVTISGGIAYYPRIKQLADLIKAADKALYLAKENGRNQICLFKQ